MKKQFKYYAITFIIFFIIVIGFASVDAGLKWEELEKNFLITYYVLLVLFRLIIYSVPAILIYFLFRKKDRMRLVDSFNAQFTTYTLMKVIWDILALDYIFSTEIFSYIDSYVVLASLFLTIVIKEKTKIDIEI